jgi:hypothetical protein
MAYEPTTALVGVATAGGRFPPEWRELLKSCVRAGLDLENGLHQRVADDPELVELARASGAQLVDLRRPPDDLNVPTGGNLDASARIVLTVGSDCAIGKMTVSLELDAEARRRGIASVFVPTGQTGIAIAGWGIAVDAVVADFIAGAAERLVLEGVERGGELLWVEGQGSLTHPQYSGVTLGLFHGAPPTRSSSATCRAGVRQRRAAVSDAAARGAGRAARADGAHRAAVAGCRDRAEHTGHGGGRRSGRGRRGRGGNRAACGRPGPFGAAKLVDAVLARLDELPE